MTIYSFWFIMIIINFIHVLWLVVCGSQKRKATSDPQIGEEIKQCELDHFQGYVTNKEIYSEWPEMKLDVAEKICEVYLRKFFPRTVFKCLVASITKVDVYYEEMENENINEIRLTALECHTIFGRTKGREYFHFIRAPRYGCMYLLNRARTSKKMNITIELCDWDTNSSLKTSGKLHTALSSGRKLCAASYDNGKLREDHERKHFEDYGLHKGFLSCNPNGLGWFLKTVDIMLYCIQIIPNMYNLTEVYSRWAEMELADKGTDKYCQIFLKKLYPKSELLSGMKSEAKIIALSYVNIVDEKGSTYLPVNVAALNCAFPVRYKRQMNYQFIKAPISGRSKCAYWVNKENKSRRCRITKELCENKMVEVEIPCDKGKHPCNNDSWNQINSWNQNVILEGAINVHSPIIKDEKDEEELEEKPPIFKHYF